MKKTIIFHQDWNPLIDSLPNEQRLYFWDLYSHYSYGSDNECKDPIVKPTWSFILSQLDKWNGDYKTKVIDRNKVNGLKGGRPITQVNPNNPMGYSKTQITQPNPTEPNKTLNDNENDNENVNEKDNEKEKVIKPKPTTDEIISLKKENLKNEIAAHVERFGRDTCNDFYRYWSEKVNGKPKLRYELEKTWELELRLINWKKREHERQ